MKKIDKTIWKKIDSFDQTPEFRGEIYSHKENFNNNGDKFLIHMNCESQPFMLGNGYNDNDYNLPLLRDQEDIVFVVCGNWEINNLIHFFRNIRIQNG